MTNVLIGFTLGAVLTSLVWYIIVHCIFIKFYKELLKLKEALHES